MAPIAKRPSTANYLISEAKGMYRSRDAGTVINESGTDTLLPGSLLGRLTTGSATATADSENTGNPTIGTITVASEALIGTYVLTFLTATTFSVARPDGVLLTNGATGTAYNQGGLGFTVTVGVTPAEEGDAFTIAVSQRVGDYTRHTLGESDGSQTVAGILFEEVAPGATEERTITCRDCEVNGAHLIYAAGSTGANIDTANAALLALGIVVR
ncbi:MAG: head decoration protein [Pigmentiphaga sp.]|nr:head decoration protein [Pigmentiphaga sp.]